MRSVLLLQAALYPPILPPEKRTLLTAIHVAEDVCFRSAHRRRLADRRRARR